MPKFILKILIVSFLFWGCSKQKEYIEINGENYAINKLIQEDNYVTILTEWPDIKLYIPNNVVRLYCGSNVFYYWDMDYISYTLIGKNETTYSEIVGKFVETKIDNSSTIELDLRSEDSYIKGTFTGSVSKFGRLENYVERDRTLYTIERVLERDSALFFIYDDEYAIRITLEENNSNFYVQSDDNMKIYACRDGNKLSIDFRIYEKGTRGNYTGEIEIEK